MSLADTLADQLGHIRIQRVQLGMIEAHLLAAIDVAHILEQGTVSSTATLPGPSPSPGAAVAVDEHAEPHPELVHPEPTPTPPSKKGSKYDLEQVAVLAREAITLGISQKKHVHDKLHGCPSPAMGSFLITSARQAGHDIPKRRSGPTAATPATKPVSQMGEPQVPGKHFGCSTCPHTTHTVRDIIRHARADHGRDAYTSERMPM